jgi:hypothetical protein
MNHVQLSSRFILQRLVKIIKNCPLLTVATLIEVVIVALKLIYGDWAEAYERLPVMLYAMKAKNPGMHFEYVPKP